MWQNKYAKQSGAGNLSNTLNYELFDCIVTKEFSDELQTLEVSKIVVTVLMSNTCIQVTCKSALNKKLKKIRCKYSHDTRFFE